MWIAMAKGRSRKFVWQFGEDRPLSVVIDAAGPLD